MVNLEMRSYKSSFKFDITKKVKIKSIKKWMATGKVIRPKNIKIVVTAEYKGLFCARIKKDLGRKFFTVEKDTLIGSISIRLEDEASLESIASYKGDSALNVVRDGIKSKSSKDSITLMEANILVLIINVIVYGSLGLIFKLLSPPFLKEDKSGHVESFIILGYSVLYFKYITLIYLISLHKRWESMTSKKRGGKIKHRTSVIEMQIVSDYEKGVNGCVRQEMRRAHIRIYQDHERFRRFHSSKTEGISNRESKKNDIGSNLDTQHILRECFLKDHKWNHMDSESRGRHDKRWNRAERKRVRHLWTYESQRGGESMLSRRESDQRESWHTKIGSEDTTNTSKGLKYIPRRTSESHNQLIRKSKRRQRFK